MKKIIQKFPDAKLWIVGRGDERYEEYLKEKASTLGIKNHITFFGFVSENEKFILMQRAHVLINPSQREGFGLTVPEAGVVGMPAVAYNTLGLRDIIQNNENGILVKENTVLALADAISSLLEDAKKYKKLSEGALRYGKKYNWDNTAKTALSILSNL